MKMKTYYTSLKFVVVEGKRIFLIAVKLMTDHANSLITGHNYFCGYYVLSCHHSRKHSFELYHPTSKFSALAKQHFN